MVGRQPSYTFQLINSQPPCRLMLFKRQATTLYITPVAMHCQMKLGIVPLHRRQWSLYNYARLKLLPNLPFQGLFPTLSHLNLTTRELPIILPLTISPLRSEDTTPCIMDYGCNYLYLIHTTRHFVTARLLCQAMMPPSRLYTVKPCSASILAALRLRLPLRQ